MPALPAAGSAADQWTASSGGMSSATVPLVETMAPMNTFMLGRQTAVMMVRHTDATLFTTWITADEDRRDHAVTDEAVDFRWKSRNPAYKAVCGYSVWPIAMESPPGPYCPRCLAYLRSRATQYATQSSRASGDFRPNWLTRVVRRVVSELKR